MRPWGGIFDYGHRKNQLDELEQQTAQPEFWTDSERAEKVMKEILDFIETEITEGRVVYLHCFRGLGRTGTVVGCYLIRNGADRCRITSVISNLRKGVAGDFRKSPENDFQMSFIDNWSG